MVHLGVCEVNSVPLEQVILPSARPFNSVYGTDRGIFDTPRNVTIFSREQLTSISIQDVRDFDKLTTSSYTRTTFGAPGTPDIRGLIGDMFLDGMRNGLPIDFNSVESINIVKCPATAVYDSSQYVDGYADMISKRPRFDAARGSVSVTAGSFDILRWTPDYGAPVNDKLAYRLSYSGEHSDGYRHDSNSARLRSPVTGTPTATRSTSATSTSSPARPSRGPTRRTPCGSSAASRPSTASSSDPL